ncbi:MAG: chromate transporter-domain-containing protein [Benniella sp.]|nr:MAG: chromate transporter-domain-containing protein [Benniella sp.]
MPAALDSSTTKTPPLLERLKEILVTYARFSYVTFGGPSAHVAILYNEIIVKRHWVSKEQFAELVSISQALPGPASAKIAYSLALIRSGLLCAIFAFMIWSILGATVMTVVGVLIGSVKGEIPLWALRLEQGLSAAAIGLVVLAAFHMSAVLTTDKLTKMLALLSGSITVLYSAPWLLPTIMVAGAITSFVFDGYLTPFFTKWKAKKSNIDTSTLLEASDIERGHTSQASAIDDDPTADNDDEYLESTFVYSKRSGLVYFTVFMVLLIAAIVHRVFGPSSPDYGTLASTFYVVGSIIFGGGHVVVPLLKTYTADVGWMTDQQFLVGLAIIQSLPGPNFNFACFLGAVAMSNVNKNPIVGAMISFVAIYFPGLVLKNAIIPFWQMLRERPSVKMIFRGVNSCALGFIFSAAWLLWLQVTATGGNNSYHAVIVATAAVLSGYIGLPVPIVIILGGIMGVLEYVVSDI